MTIADMRRTVLASVFIVCLAIFLPAGGFACSCIPPRPPEEAIANADVVFTGRVDKIDSRLVRGAVLTLKFAWTKVKSVFGGPDPHEIPDPPESNLRVRFEEAQSYKGAVSETILVLTGYSSGDCGFPFKKGESYLVYAFVHDDSLHTSICTRTAPVHAAAADLDYLAERDSNPPSGRPDA